MIVVAVRCHYCSKGRNPSDVMRLSGGVAMCIDCLQWHRQAMDAFAGNPPSGCQGCGTSFHRLPDICGNVVLKLVPKDGIYQVLCEKCYRVYVHKRADLFGDTEYGYREGVG